MVKVKVLKKGNSYYIEIPAEAVKSGEMEVFHLRDSYYLLSPGLPKQEKPQKKEGMKPEEKKVILKLLSIRFGKRTPDYVGEVFSAEEKRILKDLESKKMINVFRSKKYENGVYNINDEAYVLAKGRKKPEKKAKTPETVGSIDEKGFMIIKNKNKARDIAEKFRKEMKKGSIKGVKGFDGRFYLVKKSYYQKTSPKIKKIMETPMGVEEISKKSGIDYVGCRALLLMMSEKGEIIEKKKGIYELVG